MCLRFLCTSFVFGFEAIQLLIKFRILHFGVSATTGVSFGRGTAERSCRNGGHESQPSPSKDARRKSCYSFPSSFHLSRSSALRECTRNAHSQRPEINVAAASCLTLRATRSKGNLQLPFYRCLSLCHILSFPRCVSLGLIASPSHSLGTACLPCRVRALLLEQLLMELKRVPPPPLLSVLLGVIVHTERELLGNSGVKILVESDPISTK